ncbi:MAG TPA: PspC domain-containing protein [Candidatus Paceibacterota bacterium]|nr:PspC domain-containing protein [Candidatus Paceibacterota bacterium]
MNSTPKKLYRSRTDRIIAGVCGGLGEFFNIDPVLFRIVFIVLLFSGGSGILIYLVMMLIIPKEEDGGLELSKEKAKETIKESAENIKKGTEEMARKMNVGRTRSGKTGKIFALFLIALGLVAFLHEIFPMPWFQMNFIGPLVIIFIGLLILFRN